MKQSELIERLRPVTAELSSSIAKNFPIIQFPLENSYNLPDIDPIRHEICLCLLCSLNQASITLTNHLLEKFLKLSLFYNETKMNDSKTLEEAALINEKILNKYKDKDLSETINLCCSKHIINKEQKRKLKIFLHNFRNAYSHADIDKTFGNSTIPLALGSFSNPEKIEMKVYKVKDFPMVQGIIQKKFADETACEYFHYIDNLIRDSIDIIFKTPVHNSR